MTAYRKALSCLAALCMALCLAACGMPQENAGNDEAAATLPAEGAVEVSKDTRYIHPLFDDVLVEKDIPYGSAVDYTGQTQTLLLDVYTPEGDTETKRPAIIWVHGGGFTSGSKDTGIERILAEAFARKGYVCLSIDYRLRDDTSDWYGTLSDTVADAYTAVKWAIAHSGEYGIDPDHIALGGHSAGGNIVTGLYNDAVPEDALEPVFGIINMAGGSYGLGAIKGPAPPCLLLHGTQDDIVPYMGAADCMERLSQAGIEATFYTLDEGTHDFYPFTTEVEDVITRFLYGALTGIADDIPIRKGVAVRYREECRAGQIDLAIDGDLSEWEGAKSIPLDQLKEAGSALPDPQDCTGSAMIGWHAEDPARVYFACTVTDDTLSREPGVPLYETDTVEVYQSHAGR
jgi:acetyl esterase/lipase